MMLHHKRIPVPIPRPHRTTAGRPPGRHHHRHMKTTDRLRRNSKTSDRKSKEKIPKPATGREESTTHNPLLVHAQVHIYHTRTRTHAHTHTCVKPKKYEKTHDNQWLAQKHKKDYKNTRK